MSNVERIPRTGIIPVVATIRFCKLVIGDIVDASHGESRAKLVSFRSMVVYDIKNDFDSSLMQSRHHHLELLNGVLLNMFGGVTAGRSKISQGVIPPVIRQPPFEQMTVIEKIVHRFQFDRSDPEIGQVFDDRFRSQARVSSSKSLPAELGAIE